MRGDLELALCGCFHILDELFIVLGVKVMGWVGGCEIPLGLGCCSACKAHAGSQRSGCDKDSTLHG